MIAAPQKDLSEEEAQKIITYMEAGGKVEEPLGTRQGNNQQKRKKSKQTRRWQYTRNTIEAY